ncbi:MAG: chaperone modulator CbpM [Sneathiella sp.]|uniref:MerR family transcriptional regulator n=1 Tax=Sneathiella sp. TaxID=1964365 RepID=UPI0030019563
MMITEQELVERLQGVSLKRLRLWVKRGWIAPAETSAGYHFSDIDVARLELVRQLKIDMAVNNDAIPIVLSLIDQLHGLRFELKSLARAVESQHKDIQSAIVTACEEIRRRD